MKKRRYKKKERNLFIPISIALVLFVLIILLEKNSNIILHDGDLYNENNFNKENMFYSYEDENYTSIIGIDVSEHNGKIDWQKVKESGIDLPLLELAGEDIQKATSTLIVISMKIIKMPKKIILK